MIFLEKLFQLFNARQRRSLTRGITDGKRKLIEFFRITELTDTYLSNELFNVIRNS